MILRNWLIIGSLLSLAASALGSEESSDLRQATVEKIGETTYRLGEIVFDTRTRELRVPVVVNMREGGPIEYLLVHETGKIHESIFVTSVSPTQLQIALKLLKYHAAAGDVLDPILAPENRQPGADRGDAVSFRFDPGDGTEAFSVSPMIIDRLVDQPMREEPWIYTGSKVENGVFAAEAQGSLIAIYLDPLAMFNSLHEGASDDEHWVANPDEIPDIGVKGWLVISNE